MTDNSTSFRAFGKSTYADSLRETIGFAAQRLVVLEVGGLSGAARLMGAILLEQNDEWAVQRARYISGRPVFPIWWPLLFVGISYHAKTL